MNKHAQELRDMATEELEAVFIDTSKELYTLRNEFSANKKVDKPHLFKSHKVKIARIKTILNERKKSGKE